MQPFATYTFGQVLLTVFEFALLVLWIWVAVRVLVDVFSSPDLSGWSRAGWLLLIVLVPLLGVVVYLIARGDNMSRRGVDDAGQHERGSSHDVGRAGGHGPMTSSSSSA
jgi:hypothetical protein